MDHCVVPLRFLCYFQQVVFENNGIKYTQDSSKTKKIKTTFQVRTFQI